MECFNFLEIIVIFGLINLSALSMSEDFSGLRNSNYNTLANILIEDVPDKSHLISVCAEEADLAAQIPSKKMNRLTDIEKTGQLIECAIKKDAQRHGKSVFDILIPAIEPFRPLITEGFNFAAFRLWKQEADKIPRSRLENGATNDYRKVSDFLIKIKPNDTSDILRCAEILSNNKNASSNSNIVLNDVEKMINILNCSSNTYALEYNEENPLRKEFRDIRLTIEAERMLLNYNQLIKDNQRPKRQVTTVQDYPQTLGQAQAQAPPPSTAQTSDNFLASTQKFLQGPSDLLNQLGQLTNIMKSLETIMPNKNDQTVSNQQQRSQNEPSATLFSQAPSTAAPTLTLFHQLRQIASQAGLDPPKPRDSKATASDQFSAQDINDNSKYPYPANKALANTQSQSEKPIDFLSQIGTLFSPPSTTAAPPALNLLKQLSQLTSQFRERTVKQEPNLAQSQGADYLYSQQPKQQQQQNAQNPLQKPMELIGQIGQLSSAIKSLESLLTNADEPSQPKFQREIGSASGQPSTQAPALGWNLPKQY